MMKKALVAAAFAASTLGLAGVAGAAAEKYPLIGPDAVVVCSTKAPIDSAGEPFVGFVVFNHSQGDNTLKATVSLKDGEPNTEYPVRLVQNNADCHTVDGILTTNGQGNGTLTIREASTEAGSAQVIVDSNTLFQNPTYRATEAYVWS